MPRFTYTTTTYEDVTHGRGIMADNILLGADETDYLADGSVHMRVFTYTTTSHEDVTHGRRIMADNELIGADDQDYLADGSVNIGG
jgi:hypothetical protein